MCSKFSPEDVLCLQFSQRIDPILWLYTTIACIVIIGETFLICKTLSPIDKNNAVQKVYWSTGFAVVLPAMQRIHEAAVSNECIPALICIFSEKCLFAVSE